MTAKYDMTIGGKRVPAESYREIRNPADTEECGIIIFDLRGIAAS